MGCATIGRLRLTENKSSNIERNMIMGRRQTSLALILFQLDGASNQMVGFGWSLVDESDRNFTISINKR